MIEAWLSASETTTSPRPARAHRPDVRRVARGEEERRFGAEPRREGGLGGLVGSDVAAHQTGGSSAARSGRARWPGVGCIAQVVVRAEVQKRSLRRLGDWREPQETPVLQGGKLSRKMAERVEPRHQGSLEGFGANREDSLAGGDELARISRGGATEIGSVERTDMGAGGEDTLSASALSAGASSAASTRWSIRPKAPRARSATVAERERSSSSS